MEEQLKLLSNKFLCCYPINKILWQEFVNLSWDDQNKFLNYTVNHNLNQTHPVKQSYQYAFLKAFVRNLEQNNLEVHDAVYERLASLCESHSCSSNFTYKHYAITSKNQIVTLKESKTFISEGTTGLCSWQASLALSEWLLKNPERVAGKVILELGAGTGLTGMVAAKCCNAKSVTLTDGSPVVVNLLQENIELNFTGNELDKMKTCLLQWEHGTELDSIEMPDILLGADITFDSSVFPALVEILEKIFLKTEGRCVMYLAATIRNENTFRDFENLLDGRYFEVYGESYVSPSSDLIWDESTPIKIYSITHSNHNC